MLPSLHLDAGARCRVCADRLRAGELGSIIRASCLDFWGLELYFESVNESDASEL
jgi:hypothetical protein